MVSNIAKDLSGVPVLRLEAEKPYRIEFTLRNGGNAVAKSVMIKSNWAAVPTPLAFPIPPPYASVDHPGEVSRLTLGIGDTVLHPSLLQPQTAHNFQGVLSGAMKLYVFGEISYSDMSGNEYSTTFCARYQPETGDWAFGGTYNDAM